MYTELSIIIPAAGIGRRMKSYGPKSLIELNERYTLIGRQQSILQKEFPTAEIIVVVGYEADTVMRKLKPTVRPVENELYATTNVVRSIGMGLRLASHKKVLIVYGDLVFNAPAIRIVNNYSVAVIDNNKQMNNDEVGVTIVDGRVTRFSYDLETKWAQIVYLTGRELELFRKIVWDRNHSKWFGYEALNDVINNGGSIRAISPKKMKIIEIDTSKDIQRAREIF